MARPAFGLVLVGWLCAAGAAFLVLFDHDATDDYAGWVLAIVVAQAPAILALWPSPSATLTDARRRRALVFPAALVAGVAVFWLTLPILLLVRMWSFLALSPLVSALAAVIVGYVRFGRILDRLPHPRGARRVLLEVAAVGGAGAAAAALWFDPLGQPEWLAVAVPVAWALPLYLLASLQPLPEPPIPRAAVARAAAPGD
jgi:hypothetical protein